MAIMGAVSFVVSKIFKDKNTETNPELHLSLFTSPKWPQFLRNAFLLGMILSRTRKTSKFQEMKSNTDCHKKLEFQDNDELRQPLRGEMESKQISEGVKFSLSLENNEE